VLPRDYKSFLTAPLVCPPLSVVLNKSDIYSDPKISQAISCPLLNAKARISCHRVPRGIYGEQSETERTLICSDHLIDHEITGCLLNTKNRVNPSTVPVWLVLNESNL
jgi:hypothetical protein